MDRLHAVVASASASASPTRLTLHRPPRENERPSYLTVEEQCELSLFYQGQLQVACRAMGYSREVQGVAMMFFKRFYLERSMLQHQPKHIMLTCIFLATKAETCMLVSQSSMHVPDYHHTRSSASAGVTVCVAFTFHFCIHLPYQSLYGVFLVAQKHVGGLTEEMYNRSVEFIEQAMLTDAPMIYTPVEIAIAAFCMEMEKTGVETEGIENMLTEMLKMAGSKMEDGNQGEQIQKNCGR